MRWHWVALAAGGTCVADVALAGPLSLTVYVLLSALGVAGVVVGALRSRRGRRRETAAWWCIAAAYGLWLCGDVETVLAQQGRAAGSDVVAAVLYLVAYPPLGAGLVLLARSAVVRSWRSAVLESSLVAVALTLLSCVLLIGPALTRQGRAGTGGDALGVSYLVCDIVLVSLAVHLLTGTSARRVPTHLLGAAGLVLVVVCDGSWVLIGYEAAPQQLLAVGVPVSGLLWAAAALLPRRALPAPAAVSPSAAPRHRLVVLTAALALPSALLAALVALPFDGPAGSAQGWQVWAVVVAGALMAVLVVLHTGEADRAGRASLEVLAGMSLVLQRQADHDALTGLANRARSRERLELALRATRSSGRASGVLLVDLDGFKAVNDTHGHRAGDDVLRAVAGRLLACVRSTDLVGRLGGDEFVVVLTDLDDEAELLAVGRRVVGATALPVLAGGQRVTIGASVGAVLSADGATDSDALLHEADTAAYRAKSTGRGRVVLHDDDLRRELAATAALEAELRTAIATDQLVLHYQPVVDVRPGTAIAAEALVRWRRPGRGLVGPGEFVPVAEASDLICDLGRWVLRSAAGQLAAWARLHPRGPEFTVGVNLAPRHLAQPGAADDVAAALADAGADPRSLVVEVTETDLAHSPAVVENLRRLRALGVRVAIDDFGTGWTSIGQLQHLPCDILKIDRSLVVSTAPGAAELLALAVRAGRAFGMLVVAEGVETPEQEAAALAAGAELGQGWRWAPALPAADLDAVVAAGGDLSVLRAPAPVL